MATPPRQPRRTRSSDGDVRRRSAGDERGRRGSPQGRSQGGARRAGRGADRAAAGTQGGRPRRGGERGTERATERIVGHPAGRRAEPPRTWGSVARRGARVVGEPAAGSAADARRREVARARSGEREEHPPRPPWEPEVWVRDEEEPPSRRAAAPRHGRAGRSLPSRQGDVPTRSAGSRGTRLAGATDDELRAAVGPGRAVRLEQRLSEATRAYERDRYQDALRLLRPLATAAPGAPAVRELLGLTLYRMSRWTAAIKELEAFHALTGSLDQHPVLADCHRALLHWATVDELWDELRRVSPGAELVAEGRIVAAGALADRGDVAGAIRLLERSVPRTRRLRLHHVRQLYALADLYERAGDIPSARDTFRTVLGRDPGFVDVAERLAALG